MAMPKDIQAYNEDQAMAELERLDALAASRTLRDAEHNRLIWVEKRLEQFSDPEVLTAQNQAAERALAGEVLDIPEVSEAAVQEAKARGQFVELGPIDVSHRGLSGAALLGGVLIVGGIYYALRRK